MRVRALLGSGSLVAALLLSAGGCVVGSDDPGPGAAREPIAVPDVKSSPWADAATAVEDAGLAVALDAERIDPSGCQVRRQEPAAGTDVEPGSDVTLTLDCRQIDWTSRQGRDWERFTESFARGFDDGCRELFAFSPDGFLYRGDKAYTALDCTRLSPGYNAESSDAMIPEDVPSDPQRRGYNTGYEQGCRALLHQERIDVLHHGPAAYGAPACLAARGRAAEGAAGAEATAGAEPGPDRRRGRPADLRRAGAGVYRVPGNRWAMYSRERKADAARLFVARNPRRCRGIPPRPIPFYVDISYGRSYSLATLASTIMLRYCKLYWTTVD